MTSRLGNPPQSPCPRPRPSALARGFTLVELMIVVMIIGVLAVLAVVGFRKLISQSRTTEAIGNVNAIKVAQENYHSEKGSYANISKSACTSVSCASLYPQLSSGKSAVGDYKAGWGVACSASSCNAGYDWSMLAVHITGGVMYGYSTVSGYAGVAPGFTLTLPHGPTSTYTLSLPNAAGTPSDWYVVTAVGDENGDGVPTVVVGTTFTNDLEIANEGD